MMSQDLGRQLAQLGFQHLQGIFYQLSPAQLYEEALQRGEGSLTPGGAMSVTTGAHTGRAPRDRYIVRSPESDASIHWGKVNLPLAPESFDRLFDRMMAYFYNREVFVQDCFAGAEQDFRLPVRVITETAWHNLFARNMFINPSADTLVDFAPGYTVIHAPGCTADMATDGTNSKTFIVIHLEKRLVLIGGTGYAGEIKKSIFSILNYLLPEQNILPMHCAANTSENGDTALFFGLSGTGKTTLSADSRRILVGDDEHGWGDDAVFNFEGGCYAKVIRLSPQGEPEIYAASGQFGTLLENVVLDSETRQPDFDSAALTENTRASYPISAIPNASATGIAAAPRHIIFLTCDAFGVLPPVSRLTREQALVHFLSGYTAKVAGTEKGISEPQVTFSACFGAPFMPRHPQVYAQLLLDKIDQSGATVWLVNTGWTSGPFGVGQRISLTYTRSIINAILNGMLYDQSTWQEPFFGLHIPNACPGVPDALLNPRSTWANADAYQQQAEQLQALFEENYRQYTPIADPI